MLGIIEHEWGRMLPPSYAERVVPPSLGFGLHLL
jgi:hypothetical protein